MFGKRFFGNVFDDDSGSTGVHHRFVQNRIKMAEKYIPALRNALFDYTEKMAGSRDCVDRIAEVLEKYAGAEHVTTAFKLRIGDFAKLLLEVGTRQDVQVRAMETRVLEQLSNNEKLCSNVRSELKMSAGASAEERNMARKLQKLRASQSGKAEQISLAEARFLKAKGESARCWKNLRDQTDVFERNRLNALRESLLAWSLAELEYHSKALELFTELYRTAAGVDVNADMEEFRKGMLSDCPQRPEAVLRVLA